MEITLFLGSMIKEVLILNDFAMISETFYA